MRGKLGVLADAGEPAGLERRNYERVVTGVVVEPPRTHEPRIGKVGILRDDRLHARQHGAHVARDKLGRGSGHGLIEVDVRPSPQVVRRGQHITVGNRDAGERPADRPGALAELRFLQHNEREPRTQPQSGPVRRRRRVAPNEILVVELDRGQVVGFVVRDPRPRIGAENGATVDADDVARAVERDVLCQGRGERCAATDRISGDLQLDMRRGAGLDARVVVRGDDRDGDPLAQPRQERVGAKRAHAAISNCGSTCSVPLSVGSLATARAT